MNTSHHLATLKRFIHGELVHLFTVNKSQRPWHVPFIAATAISVPVFVGAYFGNLPSGIKASLGALVILNLPLVGKLPYRIVTMLTWSFAMLLCFTLGLITQHLPILRVPVFAVVTFVVVVLGRYYRQPPPSGLFIIMAMAIALFMPLPLAGVLPAIGVMMLGSGFAVIIALCYSVFLIMTRPVRSAPSYVYEPDTISESLVVTGFVSLTLILAMMLKMSNPYWAAVSCLIIIQGIHLRTIWIKQFHRLLGTLLGIGLASWMLSWGLSMWGVATALLIMMLSIESLIDRHYGLAVIFITPLTIFLAEYGSGLPLVPEMYGEIIQARMLDTALGCLMGLGGGLVMHSTKIRTPLRRVEHWLLVQLS